VSTPRRALVLVDVQGEYFDGPLRIAHPPVDVSLPNVLRAVDAAVAGDLPVVVVQHDGDPAGPVFAPDTPGWALHPDVAARVDPGALRIRKRQASAFAGTGLADRLRADGVDTVVLAGYMTNNCDLATAADAQALGFAAELLSDATGAIHLANEAGSVSAEALHTTLMVLLQSNFAAVATTDDWVAAVRAGEALATSNLVVSALAGREAFG
jgi:nicotinamidase-related amidase